MTNRLTKDNIQDIMALTPLQEGMLYHYLKEPGSELYFEQLCLHIPPVARGTFENAWNRVIRDHEALRTVFRWDNLDNPIQAVLREHQIQPQYHGPPADPETIIINDRAEKFDLHDVPFRITLHETENKHESNHYLMIISHHHILYDGWSTGIILKDFFAHIDASPQPNSPQPTPRPQFKTFVKWLSGHDPNAQQTYWTHYLRDMGGKTGLPHPKHHSTISQPGINQPPTSQSTINQSTTPPLTEKLTQYARTHHLTLATLLYTTWGLLLQGYNDRDDVVFGTTISGRPAQLKGIENVVGLFINTIPLRIRTHPGETLDQLTQRLHREIRQREPHEPTAAAKIKTWSGTQPGEPLYDTIMVIENYPVENRLKKLSHQSFHQTNFPMNLGVLVEDIIELRWVFDTHCYDADFIGQLGRHFLHILEEIITRPEQQVHQTSIIPVDERRQLLETLNHASRTVDSTSEAFTKTLIELFTDQVRQHPHRTALTGGERENANHMLTYAETARRASHLAGKLMHRGIGPRAIVGLLADRTPQMIIGILGILWVGGAYMPIDPTYPTERIKYMLDDTGARVLLTGPRELRNHPYTALSGLSRPKRNKEQTLTQTLTHALTPPRQQLKNLDTRPMVRRSAVDYQEYQRYIGQAMVKNAVSLQATRGCPYRCTYCHKIWPKTHVYRSAENIMHEVRKLTDAGVRRFAFIDDIFNLNARNSREFFESIIKANLDVEFFFPNGMRGDLLTKDYIDLMVEAGTVNLALALETASPRLQTLLQKNLRLEKLHENLEYLCTRHPGVILELFTMHGFPTESEDEATMTLEFIKSLKWLHFPYVHILKVYPGTDMADLAEKSGISPETIAQSADLAYHQLPDTLPFDKRFTQKYQAEFLNRYFLNKERLLHVLPHQLNILTEAEIVRKYDSYLPIDIRSLKDLLDFADISEKDLQGAKPREDRPVADLNRRLAEHYPLPEPGPKAMRVLLADLSQYYSHDGANMLYNLVEPPLGLMYLATALEQQFGPDVEVKIVKSRVDFDSDRQLKRLLEDFQPHLIGIRTLSYYKDFFHRTVAVMRGERPDTPIISGGPYATSDYPVLLKDPNIDLIVLGEGETTLCHLVEQMIANHHRLPARAQLETIPGIALPHRTNSTTSTREIILTDTQDHSAETAPTNPAPTDGAYVIYTSGTTGKPKGTLVEHRNIVSLMRTGEKLFGYNQHDIWTMYHSYCFDFSVWEMYGALLYGGRLVQVPRMSARDPRAYLELIKRQQVTILNQTPAVFYHLIEEETATDARELTLRHVIFGGEALKPGKLEPFRQKYPRTRLINMYGITETTVHVTFKEITDHEISSNTSNIGTPIGSLECLILDRHHRPMPIGAAGELYVSGHGVSRGYLNRPELTAERFLCLRRPGGLFLKKPPPWTPRKNFPLHDENYKYYKSGDLVRIMPTGEMEYLGRIDHQVKIRGNRIELGEIEKRLGTLPGVTGVLVTARTDDRGDKYLCAYLRTKPGTDLSTGEIREQLLKQLPDYMVPSRIVQLESFPLTPTGKIDHRKLPAPDGYRPTLGNSYEAPGSGIAQTIADIWQDVLKLEKVGIHDNFFDLGGNSMDIVRLRSRLNQSLQKNIPIVMLFEHPTIHTLESYLSQEKTQESQKSQTPPETPSDNGERDHAERLQQGRSRMKGMRSRMR